jgi:DNA-binding protein H-NS
MEGVDLQELTSEQLRKLELDVQLELKRRAKRDQARAEKQILELAQTHQVDLGKLAKGRGPGSSESLYQNPDNQFEQWSGRGRQPKWLSDALKMGATLEQFRIRG